MLDAFYRFAEARCGNSNPRKGWFGFGLVEGIRFESMREAGGVELTIARRMEERMYWKKDTIMIMRSLIK